MKKLISIILLVLVLILVSIFLFKKKKEASDIKNLTYTYNSHKIEWKSKSKKTKLPIKFDSFGRILLKAKIDNKDIGYLLFDTGYGITNLSNKLDAYSKISNQSNPILDATGKIERQNVRIINTFSLGELDLKSFKYNSDTLPNNHFYKDSISGILGINAIKHFIWDIDMQNKNITIISKQLEYENYKGFQEIDFIERPWEYLIPIEANNFNRHATLDTGSSAILILKDSLNISKNLHTTNSNATVSSSFNDIKLGVLFSSMKVGSYKLEDVLILDKNINSIRNFLGIPIFHCFQRVILDFISSKIFLIKLNRLNLPYKLSNKNENKFAYDILQSIINNGYYEHFDKNLKIRYLDEKTKDTLELTSIERTKWYGQKDKEDIKIDSVTMKVQYSKKQKPEVISVKYNDIVLVN